MVDLPCGMEVAMVAEDGGNHADSVAVESQRAGVGASAPADQRSVVALYLSVLGDALPAPVRPPETKPGEVEFDELPAP